MGLLVFFLAALASADPEISEAEDAITEPQIHKELTFFTMPKQQERLKALEIEMWGCINRKGNEIVIVTTKGVIFGIWVLGRNNK